jgi:predicted DNA-binding transcriptional regulator AlpA
VQSTPYKAGDGEFIDAHRVIFLYGVSRSTLYRYPDIFERHKIGGRTLFRKSRIDQKYEERRVAA